MTKMDSQTATGVQLLEVSAGLEGQRIDNFLLARLKGVPKTMIYRILRKGEVRVNKGRIKPDYRIKEGDIVRVPPMRMTQADEPAPLAKGLLERLEALERKEAEAEAARLTSVKRGELLDKFKEKGISDDKWINAYLKKLSISKETDIEAETADALDFYNLSHANSGGRNTPGNSGGNNNGGISAERWKGVNKALGGITPQK